MSPECEQALRLIATEQHIEVDRLAEMIGWPEDVRQAAHRLDRAKKNPDRPLCITFHFDPQRNLQRPHCEVEMDDDWA